MKTAVQISDRISHLVRQGINSTVTRVLQTSVIITKYSYWFLSVFIFFSCQKHLTQTDNSINTISKPVETPAEKFVAIDTTEYSIANYTPSLLVSDSQIHIKIQDKIGRLYQANSFQTKWLKADGPGALYNSLIDHLKNAERYGLNAGTYRADEIEQQINALYKNNSADVRSIIEADIRITETFFLFATHLKEGRITEPGHRGKIWIIQNHSVDYTDVTLLASAKNSSDINETIKELQPSNEQYRKLQKVLASYRSLEKSEIDALPVSSRTSIKPGNSHAAIPLIRRKLWLMDIEMPTDEGDSIAILNDSLYYDKGLASAVKTFQQRHGLEQNGIIAGKTLTYLNQSFKEKADMIALNMERLRWASENNGPQVIRVNIPEYKLRIYEQGTQTLEMVVIVGAVSNATPVFSDTLEHAVFSPTWTVPPSIIKEEFLPKLKKNNSYYSSASFTFYKNGVEIDPSTVNWDSAGNIRQYMIVQKPGPNNSLGLAKFVMPNNMNIYLHDTPDHKLFSNAYRALSHGCVRLSDPAKLAAYLLQKESNWDLTNIKKAMVSRKPTKVALTNQYEVHLEYNTVWADDDGNLNFREDIYGHDKRQLQQLNQINAPANLIASR